MENIINANIETSRNANLAEWVDLVRPKGQWDYKDTKKQEDNIFGLANKLREESEDQNEYTVHTAFQWKSYVFNDPSDIGNFNYGLTGRFIGNVGFKKQTLNDWAGYLQTLKDTVYGDFEKAFDEWETINTSPPFGDEPDDYYWSNQGMKYAESILNCPCPN
ncbi:toxin 44 [Spirosomataceae bacterium TFI 002]|nr:toxin 44 [Spirosomataceae bacterium TFI 002]